MCGVCMKEVHFVPRKRALQHPTHLATCCCLRVGVWLFACRLIGIGMGTWTLAGLYLLMAVLQFVFKQCKDAAHGQSSCSWALLWTVLAVL